MPCRASKPLTEAMLMMEPQPRGIMTRSATRVAAKAASTLT